jgi:hypothetical protein
MLREEAPFFKTGATSRGELLDCVATVESSDPSESLSKTIFAGSDEFQEGSGLADQLCALASAHMHITEIAVKTILLA